MNINRNNYNVYFLDYWEGNLSDDQEAMLYEFLENNQDLNSEFYSFETITLEKDLAITFPNKNQIKKEIVNLAEFEEKCIAYHEGDLDKEERSRLLILIKDNDYLLEIFNSFNNLQLSKDLTISFDSKNQLKKTVFLPSSYKTLLYRGIAAAALLLIFLGSYFLITNQDKTISDKTNQLSVSIIPAKESTLPSYYYPGNTSQTIDYRNTLKPKSIVETENKDISIKHLPLKQTAAIQSDVRNKNEIIFSRIQYLDEQNLLAYLNQPDTKKKKKSVLGRIASNLGGKVKNIFSPAKDIFVAEDNTVFWNIAETGVKGYNLLTNNSYELVRFMDKDGQTKAVRILELDEATLNPGE